MVCLQTVLDKKHWSSENTNAPPIARSPTSVYRKRDVMESLELGKKNDLSQQFISVFGRGNPVTLAHTRTKQTTAFTIQQWMVDWWTQSGPLGLVSCFFWLLRTTLENREFTTSWLNQTRGMEEALTIVQMYAVFILWPVPAGNRSF